MRHAGGSVTTPAARGGTRCGMAVAALILVVAGAAGSRAAADEGLRAGAARVDVTPLELPVLVNGGMTSRSLDRVASPLHARALVLESAGRRVAIVIVDSCMLARPFLDEVKRLAAARTGIAPSDMLVAATHTHSAPAAMGCLGTDADPAYVPFLRERIVEAIDRAAAALEPAEIGFARADAAEYTALRQWIRRPDRVVDDPFGNRTVRANMHAAANPDDVTSEAGPEDPELGMISLRAVGGRPIAVLATFSMHYFGAADLSADYFGLFCADLERRLAPPGSAGHDSAVVLLAHGCSGDIWRVDYAVPKERRPDPTIADYAAGLAAIAAGACAGVEHRGDVTLAMEERRLAMEYRRPDRQRLEWAERIVAGLGGRPPSTQEEVYAREQVILHGLPPAEVVVQALRVGDVAIATTPCETYAVTGLKIKAASPLERTLVIELANGGDGYIPPPEQHALGGYNTWPARSAGLETEAEPRICEAAIGLLERVCAAPRRAPAPPAGAAAARILGAGPVALWRLDDPQGPHAADASPHGHDAVYEPGITFWLEGPAGIAPPGVVNRACCFAGGRLRARLPGLGTRYSVAAWVWNGLPDGARDVAGWIVSRSPDHGLAPDGDHVGLLGAGERAGRLVYLHGDGAPVAGSTPVDRWSWHHVVFVRDGATARVFLDGRLEIEAPVPPTSGPPPEALFLGGRSDRADGWEGRLDEAVVFDRVLDEAEIRRLFGL